MFKENATVLMIGGSGCLGFETMTWLLHNTSAKVICFSRGQKSADLIDGVIYEQGDILEQSSVERVLKKHAVTHVLHAAALRTSACKENPEKAEQVNVGGTNNVLEAIKDYGGVKRFVFISTAAVYQVPKDDFYPDEKSPTDPLNAYTATKLHGEKIVEDFSRKNNLPSTILRPQIIFGPSRGNDGSTAGVTTAIKSAVKGENYTIPFSGRYCFSFSQDVGEFCAKALLESPKNFEIYNLPGNSYDIEEIVYSLNDQFGDGLIGFIKNDYPFAKGINCELFFADFPDCTVTDFDQAIEAFKG